MKISYKGYEIEVNREKSLGGWENIYYSIYRESDGLELVANFRDAAGNTVRGVIKEMKEVVDDPELLAELEGE